MDHLDCPSIMIASITSNPRDQWKFPCPGIYPECQHFCFRDLFDHIHNLLVRMCGNLPAQPPVDDLYAFGGISHLTDPSAASYIPASGVTTVSPRLPASYQLIHRCSQSTRCCKMSLTDHSPIVPETPSLQGSSQRFLLSSFSRSARVEFDQLGFTI